MFICRTRPSVRNTCGRSEPQHAALNISTSCHLWLFFHDSSKSCWLFSPYRMTIIRTFSVLTICTLAVFEILWFWSTDWRRASGRPLRLSLPSNSFKNVMHFLTFVYFSFWFVARLVNNTYIYWLWRFVVLHVMPYQLKFCECCRYTGVCTYCGCQRCFKRNDSHHETSRSLRMY